MKIFKKISEKFNTGKKKISSGGMTSPIEFDSNFDASKNEFLDSLTKKAVKLYEKQTDIKNFSKLVLSNPENHSHEQIVNELLHKGVIDPLEDEKLEKLADNSRFLKDLGLLD